MLKGMKVIDADAHFYEPADLWDKYMEAEFYEKRPRVIEYRGRTLMDFAVDGDVFKEPFLDKMAIPDSTYATMEQKYGDAYRAWWSMESRLKDLERYHWDLQVCLPTNGHLGAFVSRSHRELGAAICRAYNNWCHHFCQAGQGRIFFAAVVPSGNVEDQVIETRRTVEELGAVTIVLPTVAPGKWWHQPDYDPLWRLTEELDFPLSLHGTGTQSGTPEVNARYAGYHNGFYRALGEALNFPFENMISLGHFMYSGILDKFPRMRLSLLEGNSGWVPFWLNRLDKYCEGRQAVFFADQPIKAAPQEYFKRQCFVACDSDEPAIKYVVDYLGDGNLVWNTDYPHPDAPDPWEPLPGFMGQPISQTSKKRILWDNAARLYGSRLVSGRA